VIDDAGVVPTTDAVTTDPSAPLESIFRAHYARLVALARLLLDRQVEAEEVVQEAFARVLARRGAGDTAATYVERTVVNLCRDGLRRRAVIRRVPPTIGEDARPAEAVALGTAEQQRVVAAVRALPRRQRECVALRHLFGRSTSDTAEVLGIGEGSVKTHLHRGMAALEIALEDWR
jgi:RNA polymerase sigma factor (sigma-70 family)